MSDEQRLSSTANFNTLYSVTLFKLDNQCMCLACECLRVLEASHTSPAPRSVHRIVYRISFIIVRADATTIDKRIICEDNVTEIVCSNALSRSPLLADMQPVHPNAWVPVPCHEKTWTAWLTDDPLGLSTDAAELILDVIRVRSVYTQERWILSCATGS
jgi:hypothetical protein